MNWEAWRQAFKDAGLDPDFVDYEIDKAIVNSQNKETWPCQEDAYASYEEAYKQSLVRVQREGVLDNGEVL